RRSGERILAEMAVKAFFRSVRAMKLYAQYTVYGIVAVVFVPSWVKWIVLGMMGMLLLYWVRNVWKDYRGSDFMRIVVFGEGVPYRASQKALVLMALPSYVVLSLTAALTEFAAGSLWSGLATIPGAIIWFVAVS